METVELKDKNHLNRDRILCDLLSILNDISSDWERGFSDTIGAETRLIADLALESIQLVQLAAAIEKRFQRQGLPFQKLFLSDDYDVNDLKISDLVEFLYTHLNTTQPGQK
ncbi:MAG: acyl carrier protein [wastewater metagenome]|nr:acyl carrier protein [Candidatus Loosdrechtia aerotolerans]